MQLKSTVELKVAEYNKPFATDNTEKSSETCLGREEKIRQELQSQHFSGQRKEAKQIKFAIIVAKRPYFTFLSEAPIRFGWRPTIRLQAIFKLNSISLDRDKGEIEKTNKPFAVLKDNAASVNANANAVSDSPKQVCPQPKITKTQAEWTARGSVVPKRPMKNSSENGKTKIALTFNCPLKPAPELLKCNSPERHNKLEPNSNYESVKVP